MKNNRLYLLFALCFSLMLFSCGKHKEHEYHSVKEKITEEGKHYSKVPLSSEPFFKDAELIEIKEGEFQFLIPDRKGKLKMYKCTECHTKPVQDMKTGDIKKAHWDIKLNHADATIMNCTSCHNGSDMDHLKSLTGLKIDLNASYKLCGQCHSPQFSDWKGGAHGKRMGGWAEPRASFTCVNCHNPHDPSIKSRWPVRYNTQKVKERD